MISASFKDYLNQVRKYTSDLSISTMSPYQKCQVLLSPFRLRRREAREEATGKPAALSKRNQRGMSNLAFTVDSDADDVQRSGHEQKSHKKTTYDDRNDCMAGQRSHKAHQNLPWTAETPEDERRSETHKCTCSLDEHSPFSPRPGHAQSASATLGEARNVKCSPKCPSEAATISHAEKGQTNLLASRQGKAEVTFEAERPDSIGLTSGYDGLMDLASPLGLTSPSDNPLLYTNMLLSVAKCSTLVYHSR